MGSVLLSCLEQILYERIDLLWAESRLEILRHYALREARRDLGIRILDRLLDERLTLRRDAVELRPNLTCCAGIGERVAGAAAALAGEDRLAGRRGGGLSAATTAAARLRGLRRVQLRLDELL